MKEDKRIDEPARREKENMEQPQEEFISDTPPSRKEEKDEKEDAGLEERTAPPIKS